MTFLKFSFTFLVFTFSLSAQTTESEKIYQSILKATFTQDKIEIAKSLLKKNECKDGVYTEKLLKDSHYWNRETGIFLVSECKNPKLDKIVCDLFLNDHMIRSALIDLFKKNSNRFSKNLISIYKKDIWGPTKEDLFRLYSQMQDEDISNFLQEIINDTKSSDRSLAYNALMRNSKKPKDAYFRSYINDKDLRKLSLQWIVENGNKSDLSLFKEILANPKSEFDALANACLAIQKWGEEKEKKSTYLRFLKEDTQSLLPILFSIFTGLQDDEIFKEVSKLSRNGKTQLIRTEAILELKNFSGQKKFPYIILFLQEEYQSQTSPQTADAFANLFTLGLHGVFQGLQEKQKKDKFYDIKDDLVRYLQKETGEKYTSFTEWKAWANQKKLLPITITYE